MDPREGKFETGPATVLRVAVVDDSLLVQERVGRMLAGLPGVEVAGYAVDVSGAIRLIDAQRPDVVVLDVELSQGGAGLGVLQHVMRTHPGIQVIALSNLNWRAMRNVYLEAGSKAYFDKSLEFAQAMAWIANLAPPAARPED